MKLMNELRWSYELIKPCDLATLWLLLFARNQKRSVLFFTHHKCASTFLPKVIRGICTTDKRLRHLNYSNLTSDVGWRFGFGSRFPSELDWFTLNSDILFKKSGHCYGPFRYPFVFPGWEYFKSVFFLRDPRDSLISRYHSFGFSHGVPKDKVTQVDFLKERTSIQNTDINSYCIRMAREWSKPVLSTYKQMINTCSHAPLVLFYEDYLTNTEEFISKVFNYAGVSDSQVIAKQIAGNAKPIRESVDPNNHRRSGRAGQYRISLNHETIQEINAILSDEIKFFGWSTD